MVPVAVYWNVTITEDGPMATSGVVSKVNPPVAPVNRPLPPVKVRETTDLPGSLPGVSTSAQNN
jgi:hypothetical protein